MSPWQVLAQLIGFLGADTPLPQIGLKHLATISVNQAEEIAAAVLDLARVNARVGLRSDHPFHGTTALSLQPTDLDRLKAEVLSDKPERATKGISTSTSYGTEIEPLCESSCTFFLEGLFGF